jgi:hypothetical protein
MTLPELHIIRKNMRAAMIPTLLFSFLISGDANSQTKNKERFYPEEYLYPLNELGAGKTYVYKEVGGTQYRYMDIIPIQEPNQSVYVTQHYTSTEKIDSSTFSANWLLHDTYLFLSEAGPTRGKILNDEVRNRYGLWEREPSTLCTARAEKN